MIDGVELKISLNSYVFLASILLVRMVTEIGEGALLSVARNVRVSRNSGASSGENFPLLWLG